MGSLACCEHGSRSARAESLALLCILHAPHCLDAHGCGQHGAHSPVRDPPLAYGAKGGTHRGCCCCPVDSRGSSAEPHARHVSAETPPRGFHGAVNVLGCSSMYCYQLGMCKLIHTSMWLDLLASRSLCPW